VRVVVDPGVLVAGIITPLGAPARVIALVREDVVELVVSPHLIAELSDVLGRRRFRRYLSVGEAEEFVRGLTRLAITVNDPPAHGAITRDINDDYLVRLARAGGADALVSGDRDLLDADIDDIVLTPAEPVTRTQRAPETS
jgi:uncharacterized protein